MSCREALREIFMIYRGVQLLPRLRDSLSVRISSPCMTWIAKKNPFNKQANIWYGMLWIVNFYKNGYWLVQNVSLREIYGASVTWLNLKKKLRMLMHRSFLNWKNGSHWGLLSDLLNRLKQHCGDAILIRTSHETKSPAIECLSTAW